MLFGSIEVNTNYVKLTQNKRVSLCSYFICSMSICILFLKLIARRIVENNLDRERSTRAYKFCFRCASLLSAIDDRQAHHDNDTARQSKYMIIEASGERRVLREEKEAIRPRTRRFTRRRSLIGGLSDGSESSLVLSYITSI